MDSHQSLARVKERATVRNLHKDVNLFIFYIFFESTISFGVLLVESRTRATKTINSLYVALDSAY